MLQDNFKTAGAWWDAYVAAHATPDAVTWQEFTDNFKSHHILVGLMKLKKKKFLSLKQGAMSVAEFRDKFIELSRYALEDVADDGKKQELFMEGLAGPLKYQLMSHTFASFSVVDGQGYLLGVKAQRVWRSEDEGHYLCAVWD
jgi:hypothetical protein